jgi:hypothetical protein
VGVFVEIHSRRCRQFGRPGAQLRCRSYT